MSDALKPLDVAALLEDSLITAFAAARSSQPSRS